MKYLAIVKLLVLGFSVLLASQAFAVAPSELNLMPYPQKVVLKKESLRLDKHFSVVIEGDESPLLLSEVQRFLQRVQRQTGLAINAAAIKRADDTKMSSPWLQVHVKSTQKETGYHLIKDESYQLNISGTHINLVANTRVGAVRGLETVLQLIGLQKKSISVPQLSIEDAPRFVWRGVLLDSSRHFLPVDTIKRQLDAMAAAKYNIFHWHLTDDQGWRMESKTFPKLHELASDGEYYSHQQIRDVVAYAHQRGIHVLPEIDIPGHASAIAIAYPELMSAPGPYEKEIRWGVHKPTLNPMDEKVYDFVDGLMTEVTALFPFEYVHIGGDEVDPEHWNTNPAIQAFMKTNKLADHRALQAWFNRRVVKILEQHQRKMIGWDEIQHPDLPKNIVIQSWQGPDAVSDAVSHGFQAILSTGYYLDQPQPASYHYRNDPVPVMENVRDEPAANESWQTWSFEIPRKRGSAIKGSFTLISDNTGQQRGFIDFKGKSRRALHNVQNIHGVTHFQLDTWMGIFNPRVNLADGKLQGIAVVGNAHYSILGEQIAGSSMEGTRIPPAIRQPSLSDAARNLVLGGEAALWAELVDDTLIDLRLWPRAFAVGERLWSPKAMQDEDALYRRMATISAWSEVSIGLQHEQQSRNGMQQFVGKKHSIKPLQIFAEAIEQAQYYHRHHEKHVYGTYSKADPLNLFVDTLPAESITVRELDQRVERFLKNPADKQTQRQLKILLQSWVDNHKPLMKLVRNNPRLADMEPLVRHVNEVSRLGLLLVASIVQDKPLTDAQIQQARQQLHDAQQMHQEIVVSAAYPVEKLLQAAY